MFFIQPGPVPGASIAYWGPEVRVGVPQPALNVNMDAATNVESLSFSYDGLARKQLTVTIQEPITGLSIPIPVPDISILRPPLAARPAVTLRQAPLPDAAKLNPVQAALMGLGQAVADSDAVTGQGTLDVLRYGHILKARQLVSVRGAGHQLRRLLLRDQRHPHHQARRVQAELPAGPRRPRLALPGGAGMTDHPPKSQCGTWASTGGPWPATSTRWARGGCWSRCPMCWPTTRASGRCRPCRERASRRACSRCLRSTPRSGSNSSRVTRTTRYGSGAFPGRPPTCPPWPLATPAAASPIVLQTTGQHTVALSDLPGAAGGVLLKSTSGAFVSVSRHRHRAQQRQGSRHQP